MEKDFAHFSIVFLEINVYASIELPFGQIIGHGILHVVHVGNPVVGADVTNTEKVEHVCAYPDVFQVAEETTIHDGIVSSSQLIAETYIDSFLGRRTEITCLITLPRNGLRQSPSKHTLQVEFHPLEAGEIVLKKE